MRPVSNLPDRRLKSYLSAACRGDTERAEISQWIGRVAAP